MKGIVLSIKPSHCRNILAGDKTIEIRKTKPAIETPFKVYIHMTGNSVIGEFICDEIYEYEPEFYENDSELCKKTCMSFNEIKEYIGIDAERFYGWHISNFELYTEPKKLSEFGIRGSGNHCRLADA